MTINIYPSDNLYDILSDNDKILSIDIGTKTFGMAIATKGLQIVTPLNVINREKYNIDIVKIQSIISDWDIRAIIFGLPLNMDGTSGAKVQAVKTISRNIARDTNLPYYLHDERLSTSAAIDRLIDIGVKPSRRKQVIDSHAAGIILESYFYYHQTR